MSEPDRKIPQRVHVIGASGRSGAALSRELLQRGIEVIPVVRSEERWRATEIGLRPRVARVEDDDALAGALRDATHVVSTAHARLAAHVISAAPETALLVFLGSTRKFSRWPDDHGTGVIAGERAFLVSGRRGVMLHPTMIYGAKGEDNVQRLAALLRRVPVAPLPARRSLVQPIHQDDVVQCTLAALALDWIGPESLVVAGPEPLPYRDFLAAVARAAGIRPPRVVTCPSGLIYAAAAVSRRLPMLPNVTAAEIRRLLEDKAFDITPMTERLGVIPISLRDGLERTFTRAT